MLSGQWTRTVSALPDRRAWSAGTVELRGTAVRAAAGAVALLSVGLLAAGNGGYFPPAWGWSSAALLWAAVVALLMSERVALARAEYVTLISLAGLAGWMLLSQIWEGSAGQPVLEFERALVYVAGLLALTLLTRRGRLQGLLLGLLVAIAAVCLYGLAGRIIPGSALAGGVADTGRMSQPIGYWNGLGIFAALGALTAWGMLAHAASLASRLVAAAALPVLCCTLYFTYSRGGWVALGIGFLVALACDRRRGMLLAALLATAPALAATVLVAAKSGALTHAGTPLAQVDRQGHRLAAVLVGAVLVELAVAVALQKLDVVWRPSAALTRAGHAAAGVLAVAAVVGALVVVGSPVTIAHRLYDGFNGRAQGGFEARNGQAGRDLNLRLFSLSGNSRATLWRIAWNDVTAHPLLGSGAGSYERVYLAHRTGRLKVTDAHSLYLETLAELGPVGLVLLLVALGTPLVAGIRNRAHPLVPAAMGGYVAYLVHAGVDWDWELPALTLAAFALGVAMMRAGRVAERRALGRRTRVAALVTVAVLIAAALAGLRGNLALSDSQAAAARGDWTAARHAADRAVTWEPWSSQAWVALGNARYGSRTGGGDAAYRHAARLDPGDWSTWFAIASTSSGAAGAAAFERAVRLNPHGTQIQVLRTLRKGAGS
jgi:O-antigen ligase